MTQPAAQTERMWPHRLAVVLVCVTFPLIWVGGLVTTYDAGMAVPDWPTTYGYNMFLYPWQTWLAGPWDLFIEHAHRLLGALAGIVTLALVVVVLRGDRRGWMRLTVVAALIAVCIQGLLGGARVLMDERQLAMIHGCFGPAFFGLTVAIAVFTSRFWRRTAGVDELAPRQLGALPRLAMLTLVMSYFQLVLGSLLRHIPVTASPATFRVALLFHLVFAAVVAVHVAAGCWAVWSRRRDVAELKGPVTALGLLVLLQLTLGGGTWVVKYGWPAWLADYAFAAAYTVEANSLPQAMVVTAHVATGSLILAYAVMFMLRSQRLARGPALAGGATREAPAKRAARAPRPPKLAAAGSRARDSLLGAAACSTGSPLGARR